jgi:hypothetical protein
VSHHPEVCQPAQSCQYLAMRNDASTDASAGASGSGALRAANQLVTSAEVKRAQAIARKITA